MLKELRDHLVRMRTIGLLSPTALITPLRACEELIDDFEIALRVAGRLE